MERLLFDTLMRTLASCVGISLGLALNWRRLQRRFDELEDELVRASFRRFELKEQSASSTADVLELRQRI